MAREVCVTFIDRDGAQVEEIVEAINTGIDIVLSSAGGANKLVLSAAQMREVLEDRSNWPTQEAA